MAKDYAKAFYNGEEWQRTRELCMKSKDGLCENCLARGIYRPAKVVHHIVHLNPENIGNAEIALNPMKLKCLCQDCHAAEHAKQPKRRYGVDDNGNIIPDKEL